MKKHVKVTVSLCIVFLMIFSALPVELMQEGELKSARKVTGLRCMTNIFRSFHTVKALEIDTYFQGFFLPFGEYAFNGINLENKEIQRLITY